MTRTALLQITDGVSSVNGTLAVRNGQPDPLSRATQVVRARGFDHGDHVTVTGTEGHIGAHAVLFMTSITAFAAVAAAGAELAVAKAGDAGHATAGASGRQSKKAKKATKKTKKRKPTRRKGARKSASRTSRNR